jgi:hypothetical protein
MNNLSFLIRANALDNENDNVEFPTFWKWAIPGCHPSKYWPR